MMAVSTGAMRWKVAQAYFANSPLEMPRLISFYSVSMPRETTTS
jgi:hypothetical protein